MSRLRRSRAPPLLRLRAMGRCRVCPLGRSSGVGGRRRPRRSLPPARRRARTGSVAPLPRLPCRLPPLCARAYPRGQGIVGCAPLRRRTERPTPPFKIARRAGRGGPSRVNLKTGDARAPANAHAPQTAIARALEPCEALNVTARDFNVFREALRQAERWLARSLWVTNPKERELCKRRAREYLRAAHHLAGANMLGENLTLEARAARAGH